MNRVLIAAIIALASTPTLASAQQPLSEFLAAARDGSLDEREARATLRQAQSQVDEARARLLPSLTIQGSYQRNEYEVAFPTDAGVRTIQPYDALNATFQINVPLIDIGAWSSFFQTEAAAEASEASFESTRQTVDVTVVQLWHQLVGARALVAAAERNIATLEQNRDAAAARVEVGVSPQLELSRAEAELARARQSLAEARLQATLAARNLENLTGLAPSDHVNELDDDLRPMGSLSQYLENVADLPAMRAARASQRAADIAADTAWTSLLPVVSAFARENGANVAGLAGANWTWAIGVSASWQLDFGRPAQINTRAAAAEVAAVRAARAAQQTETALFDAWQRVEAARARAEAAIAGVEASQRAAQDARARYDAGASTQLDLIQADRDLFQAEVTKIQAIADLQVARMSLRIRAGQSL